LKTIPPVLLPVLLVCSSLFGQVDASSPIVTVSGGAPGFTGDGGPATAGRFSFDEVFTVRALAVDRTGNLLIADTGNGRIRQLATNGVLRTIAGSGRYGFGGDGGTATAASFSNPGSVSVDVQGRVFVGDSENFRVRRINSDETIQTVAGGGSLPVSRLGLSLLLGPVAALDLRLDVVRDVAVDPQGRVYVYTSSQGGSSGFRVKADGYVDTGCCPGVFDGQGNLYYSLGSGIVRNGLPYPGGTAGFSRIGALALDKQGNLYVAEKSARRIRKISANGVITTVVGTGREALGNAGDGDGGTAGNAKLGIVNGMTFDPNGNLYFTEMVGTSEDFELLLPPRLHRIRKVGNATGGGSPNGAPQILQSRGIVNGASFIGPVARGSWATIYGQNLTTGATRTWTSSDFVGNRLPTSLEGTTVTFNDIPSAVYFVSPTQINVQVPDGLPNGNVTVKVATAAGTDSSLGEHREIEPGLFTTAKVTAADGSVYFYPAAVHLDGTLVGRPNIISGSRPAVPGETLLVFGTGFGPSTPTQPSGQLIPSTLLSSRFLARIGSSDFNVSAAALISPGLYQFNLTVPPRPLDRADYLFKIFFPEAQESQVGVYIPVN